MAKINGIQEFELDDHRFHEIENRNTNNVKESILDVLKTKKMSLRFFNMCFCWMTVTMVYYGLSLNATNLAGNPYTNFLLVSLVELPGKFCFNYGLKKCTKELT